jgi:hypothetical protein
VAELAELERALVNADAAGDVEAAKVLATEIKKVRAPQRSMGEELGRQVGLTGRAAVKGVLGIPAMVGDALFGLVGQPGRTSAALDRVLNNVFPAPENATERVVQDVTGSMAGMGSVAQLAKYASPMSAPLSAVSQTGKTVQWNQVPSSVMENIGASLFGNLPAQTASTVAASGAAGVTRESGGGPGAQLMAGLTAGVAAPMALQSASNIGAKGITARSLQKSEQTPFAQEGERLANTTGIDLTPGARTGNRMVTALENTARQYGPTADRVQDIDIKIANQAINRVTFIADKISTKQGDPETLGNQILGTVQSAARKLADRRETVANRDYSMVREIAGDGKVIRLNNFSRELQKIIDDFSGVAGDDAEKVVNKARATLSKITGTVQPGTPARTLETPTGRPIKLFGTPSVSGTLDNTIDEAMRTRSFYGKAARGGANVFEGIASDLQRRLSARLFGAINNDFDDAANTVQGNLKQVLQQANQNYKAASQSIEFLEKSALGKLVGDDLVDAAMSGTRMNTTSGEQIMQRIAGMHPSVRRNSIDIIRKWNPELAQDMRAQMLRDALDQAAAIPPSTKGASQIPISFNRFLSALGSEKVGFEKNLQSYGFTASEIKDIRDVAAAILRQGDRTGTNFSGTEVMRQNMEISQAIGDATKASLTGGFSSIASNAVGRAITLAGKRVGMNRIVDAMATSEGRAALKTLTKPSASPQAILTAFAVIEPDQPKQ